MGLKFEAACWATVATQTCRNVDIFSVQGVTLLDSICLPIQLIFISQDASLDRKRLARIAEQTYKERTGFFGTKTSPKLLQIFGPPTVSILQIHLHRSERFTTIHRVVSL
jgi:hypothetical protein